MHWCNPALYERELEQLFDKGHWCCVRLECEESKAGDFKRTKNGERSVVMVRERGRLGQPDQRFSSRSVACQPGKLGV